MRLDRRENFVPRRDLAARDRRMFFPTGPIYREGARNSLQVPFVPAGQRPCPSVERVFDRASVWIGAQLQGVGSSCLPSSSSTCVLGSCEGRRIQRYYQGK